MDKNIPSIEDFMKNGSDNFSASLPDFRLESLLQKAFIDPDKNPTEENVDTFGADLFFSICVASQLSGEYHISNVECLKSILPYLLKRKIHHGQNAFLGSILVDKYQSSIFVPMRTIEAAISDFRLRQSPLAKEFLKSILNKYFRKEVKQICKYKRIDLHVVQKDILPAADDNEEIRDVDEWMSIVLVIAALYNIEMDSVVWGIHGILNDHAELLMKKCREKKGAYLSKMEEITPESQHLIEAEIVPDAFEYEMNSATRRYYNTLVRSFNFESNALRKDTTLENYLGSEYVLSDTMLLSGMDPEKLTEKEKNFVNGATLTIGTLLNEIFEYQEIISAMMGFDSDFSTINISEREEEGEQKKSVSDTPKESEDTAFQELKETRVQLHNAQQKIILLNELLDKEKTRVTADKTLKKEVLRLKNEVVALRKFAYEAAEEYHKSPSVTEVQMIEYLKDQKVAIIGGDENWHNKLKNVFPNWEYYAPQETGTFPVTAIDKAVAVYFFTGHICHPQYLRFLDHLRTLKRAPGYISRVNIKDNISQIYADLTQENQ